MVFIGLQEPLAADRNGANGTVAAADRVSLKRDCAAQRPYPVVTPSSAYDHFVERHGMTIGLAQEPRPGFSPALAGDL
jgi:hypothetical protein